MTVVATPETSPHAVDLGHRMSAARRGRDIVFRVVQYLAVLLAVAALIMLLVDLFIEGRSRLNWSLITDMPSARPERAGIQSAIWGSIWVVVTTAALSLPTGVGAAIYLEEFAHKERWYNRLIELNVQNLASIPSVVFGILGLAFVARGPLDWGFTIGTAALILTMMVLPTIVIATREALRAVPPSLRDGSLALGATRWQTTWRQVLPSAVPGIATGAILAVSRAFGESAPLLLLGALTFVTFNPEGLDSPYTVLPLQIFRYISDPRDEFRTLAAAASIVLLFILLAMNSIAIFIRYRFERRLK